MVTGGAGYRSGWCAGIQLWGGRTGWLAHAVISFPFDLKLMALEVGIEGPSCAHRKDPGPCNRNTAKALPSQDGGGIGDGGMGRS